MNKHRIEEIRRKLSEDFTGQRWTITSDRELADIFGVPTPFTVEVVGETRDSIELEVVDADTRSAVGSRVELDQTQFDKLFVTNNAAELVEDKEETFECPQCGTQVPVKSKYCMSCQEKVEMEESRTLDELVGDSETVIGEISDGVVSTAVAEQVDKLIAAIQRGDGDEVLREVNPNAINRAVSRLKNVDFGLAERELRQFIDFVEDKEI